MPIVHGVHMWARKYSVPSVIRSPPSSRNLQFLGVKRTNRWPLTLTLPQLTAVHDPMRASGRPLMPSIVAFARQH
jgi:hypothetical protein